MAQVALADVAAIVALPLVLEPGKALEAAVGGVLVAVCILLLYAVTRLLHHRPWVRQVRQWSKKRGWALDLRLSLLILFGLAWIAQRRERDEIGVLTESAQVYASAEDDEEERHHEALRNSGDLP